MRFRTFRARAVPLALLVVVLGAGVLGACGGDDDDGAQSAPDDCTVVAGDTFTFVAKNLRWNTKCLKVEPGTKVTFTVKNEDDGVQHDLQVFGQGKKETTPLEAGPVTQTLEFDFAQAGFYQFVCSVHPTMEGSIFAEA